MTNKIPQSAKTCAFFFAARASSPAGGPAASTSSSKTLLRRSGASRARTGDLLHAMQALSQLSYGPERGSV